VRDDPALHELVGEAGGFRILGEEFADAFDAGVFPVVDVLRLDDPAHDVAEFLAVTQIDLAPHRRLGRLLQLLRREVVAVAVGADMRQDELEPLVPGLGGLGGKKNHPTQTRDVRMDGMAAGRPGVMHLTRDAD